MCFDYVRCCIERKYQVQGLFKGRFTQGKNIQFPYQNKDNLNLAGK